MRLSFSAIYEALKEFEAKQSLVIIKSASDDVFKSGNDYKEIANSTIAVVKDRFQNEYRSFQKISNYNIPLVAFHCGLTTCDSSMSATYRVATEKTVFKTEATRIGFFTDSGASFYLSRLERFLGMYIGLTGEQLTAFDVKKFGLATHFVSSKNIRDLEHVLKSCDTQENCEEALEQFSFIPPNRENLELDEQRLEKIENCFGGLTLEQILENLKADGSDWANETEKTLRRMSPTSLKVCHRLLSLGRHMNLEDCAKLEWRLGVPFSVKSDLHESMKSTEKNTEPKWIPGKVEDVTEYHLTRFFGPLTDEDELTFESKRFTGGAY